MSSVSGPESNSTDQLEDQVASRRTWVLFHVVLLLAAWAYTLAGLRFEFMSGPGRPGAGFFPRIIGVGLIGSLTYVLAANWRRIGPGHKDLHRSAVLLFGLAGGLLIAALVVLGTWLAIALFLVATLAALNPGRHVVNITLSIAVPLGFFLLFDVWLGIMLPEGILLPSP